MDTILTRALYVRTSGTRLFAVLLSIFFLLAGLPAMQISTSASQTKANTSIAGMMQSAGMVFGTSGSSDTKTNCEIPPPCAGIAIVKTTSNGNGVFADGITVAAGSPVTWKYFVTNTGNVDLKYVTIFDVPEGPIGTPFDLAAGASKEVTKTGIALPLLGGISYTNIATVTGKAAVIGGPELSEMNNDGAWGDGWTWDDGCSWKIVTASDTSCYYNPVPTGSITINKTTNGADGLNILIGDPITWTYVVSNTGVIALSNIVVTDDKEGQIGTIASLAPGASETLTKTGKTAVAGHYTNTATVTASYAPFVLNCAPTGTPPSPCTVTASDVSDYYGVKAGITLVKLTNGLDNGSFPVGTPLIWSYKVTNTSDMTLTNIVVTDDKEGAIGTIATLAAGASETLTNTGTAALGVYTNTGTAVGNYTLAAATTAEPQLPTVKATDTSGYTGVAIQTPGISLVKLTNGADGGSYPVGTALTWTYKVTNTGGIPLTNILVTDNKEGTIGTIATLASGASETLTKTGKTAVAGTYTNTGTATGYYEVAMPTSVPDSLENLISTLPSVTATDDSSYTGTTPNTYTPTYSMTINKTTNGADGLTIAVGAPVTWSYVITNTGDQPLTNIVVTDNDPAIGTVGTILTLNPGATATLARAGTAAAGSYSNIGTAVCQSGGGLLTVTDPSSYIGSAAGIGFVKTVQNVTAAGAVGKTATGAVGDDFLFTLVVTNTGTITLTGISITDDKAVVGSDVTVGGILQQWTAGAGGIASLTIPTLTAGQSVTITYVYNTETTDTPETLTNIATVAATASTESLEVVGSSDTASLTTTSVLGAVRTPSSSVLGAAKTGETTNTAGIIAALTLLFVSGGLLTYIEIRRQRKDNRGK